ncbi:methylcitrate dehydratase [Oceanicola granulosus HTCC2516]|uniref:Methylcitrate dehydratase n=1 Tax=Oceanicola granulosus (strain ATCC BAA-861 / DSM 15982 / KCTC 12143 / HTCC2516) TaxID=314256 RepID=Q2CJB1_OCEGH|nr:MmgE/PrpD family protein [Oceanicola granulosus]EAR52689.1 methylcitrate dehydratase [Oceanicola granulosus HTCC2516]
MRLHAVRPLKPQERRPREDELAWKIAEVAADGAPDDPAALEMAAMRIVDDWAVAAAALNRPSVISARGAALDTGLRPRGATVIGCGDALFDPYRAGYANATAIRELDFNDSFFAADSSHPGDVIGPLAAVAQGRGLDGMALLRGIVTAYEIQVDLVKGIALNRYRIDHVAHLGPAVAAGIGTMLSLPVPVIYQAVNLAAQLAVSTRQTRKNRISSYKANAPGHVGQIAMLAVDRAMRGESSPAPVYEGDYGILAILLGGPEAEVQVPLPEPGEPKRAILETYPKEHSAGYHGQALIDLAYKMRDRIGPEDDIRDIVIRTKELTHLVMGSGAGDPEKWDPHASRETLDHSAMFIFTVALQDGVWDHDNSYAPDRVARPDTVALWRKVRTEADDAWTRAFTDPAPLDKAHGGRVVVTYADGSTYEEELRVANAHPRGARPFGPAEYRAKFLDLAGPAVDGVECARFLGAVERMMAGGLDDLTQLSLQARPGILREASPGLF